MFVNIEGDYSKLPEPIREIFKLLEEHVLELHEGYGVYRHLFMKSEQKTETLAAYTGATLAWFQNLLQDAICLQIAKLFDKDNRSQPNLSIHKLAELGVPLSHDVSFAARVKISKDTIEKAVKNIITHRHKRLGHFDLNVSLKDSVHPTPIFKEISHAIELFTQYLSMFDQEFGGPGLLHEFVRAEDITDRFETTVRKAIAYDALERAGRAEPNEWTALTKGFHQ